MLIDVIVCYVEFIVWDYCSSLFYRFLLLLSIFFKNGFGNVIVFFLFYRSARLMDINNAKLFYCRKKFQNSCRKDVENETKHQLLMTNDIMFQKIYQK